MYQYVIVHFSVLWLSHDGATAEEVRQGLHVTLHSKPRARYNCIFGGGDRIWSTNQGAGMHVHWCGRSPAARLSMAMLGVYFAPKCLQLFYDLTTDEEANDCVCVLAKARDPCR